MQTPNSPDLVALDATELLTLQGGDVNIPTTGVWIGPNGEGCIPGPKWTKPPYDYTDFPILCDGRSWAV